MTKTVEERNLNPTEKAKAHITGLSGFCEYSDYLNSRQGHREPAGDFLCAISRLVTSFEKKIEALKKENEELKERVKELEEVGHDCTAMLNQAVTESDISEKKIEALQSRISELEAQLEWKQPREALVGTLYAVDDFYQRTYIAWLDDWCLPQLCFLKPDGKYIEMEKIKRIYPLGPVTPPQQEGGKD